MYCRHCGEKIDDDSKFCTYCGKPSHFITENYNEDCIHKTKKTKRFYERWSWAAFGLGWIYFCGMKYRFWGWLLILSFILNILLKSDDTAANSIGLILWLIMIIIFGIKGRPISWESREWKSEKEFIAAQRVWDIWGIIIFVILNGIWLLIPTS